MGPLNISLRFCRADDVSFQQRSKMRNIVICTFFCSILFLIYIWSWLSWYTWATIPLAKKSCDSPRSEKSVLCKQCFQQAEAPNFRGRGNRCLESAKLEGVVPQRPRFLTIGIPTVDRAKGKYLHRTLRSLLESLDPAEKSDVVLVVLVADLEERVRRRRCNEIRNLFRGEIKSGLMLIIQGSAEFYSDDEISRRTFNDSIDRIRWRSKQVLDFAFLFHCARGASEFFLILEDDVEASSHYMGAIRSFVEAKREQDWMSLSFSGFFIIGRLLRDELLDRLSRFLVMFHMEKPVDLLIMQFMDLMVQEKYAITRRIPGLFQHVGLFSSLDGKIQKAKDRTFSPSAQYENPPADIVTTLGVYKKHFPEHCYVPSSKFFWGSAPGASDTFDIILHKPILLRRVSVASGIPAHKNDLIRYAELKLSPSFNRMATNNKANCTDFQTFAFFRAGAVDLSFKNATQPTVQCFRIEFVKKQLNWILIKEIAIQAANLF